MRQAVITNAFGIENIVWRDIAEPQPGPGQVLVRMRAASLNYRDYLVATGSYNPKMPLPRVPLSDGSGEVIGLGAGVTTFSIGERVAGTFMQSWLTGPYRDGYGKSALGGAIDGVLAEQMVFGADGLIAVPSHLSFEEAATLPCAAVTAWNALFENGPIRAGETVLVQGSGGVSVFALQFAKMAGARVIAISSNPIKIEKLKNLGADWVLNYRQNAEWGKAIAKAGGVDHVVEVGGAGTLEQSLHAVRAGGKVSMIGILSGVRGTLNIASILHKHLRIQGIYVGSHSMFKCMNHALSQNQIRPVIDCVYEGAQIQEALRFMESAEHFGKIVICL